MSSVAHSGADPLAITAALVAILALVFTVGSFWWLHARPGPIKVTTPHAYAFVAAHRTRLRLPLALYNSGARAQVVEDLRLCFADEPTQPPLRWETTRDKLRPGGDDGFAFGTPFAIDGRQVREVIVEFGEDGQGWFPDPLTSHRLRLEARLLGDARWVDLLTFAWYSPSSRQVMQQYIAHRNEPVSVPLS